MSIEEHARELTKAEVRYRTLYYESQSRISELERQLEWFKRQVFGARTERRLCPEGSKQLCLGEYEPLPTPPPPETTVKAYERSHRREKIEFSEEESRLKFDASVPVEVINVPPPEVEGEYEVIGEEISYKLSQRPGSYVVLKYVRPTIKVKETKKIKTAPPTSAGSVIEGGIAEVSFIAGLVLDKFLYHLPLYRQHQRLTASGVHLNRMTLTNIVHRGGELLEPVYRAHQSSILSSHEIGMDETPVKVDRDPEKRQMKKGYLWAIYGDKDEISFLFSPSRGGKVVRDVLKDFEGTLVTDGYKVYEKFAEGRDEIIHAQCWVHVRRKFFEAQNQESELCKKALSLIGELYRIERELGPPGRKSHSAPIVDEFFSWLRETAKEKALVPSSPFMRALSYALQRERALRVFLSDEKVPLDTNHVERQIRPTVIGRKNWLFHWTEVGAEKAAILQSLVASCKLQNVDPYIYLVDVLQRISSHPMHNIHLLTPRLWKQHFQSNPMKSDLKSQ